jgi:hypothetical protein
VSDMRPMQINASGTPFGNDLEHWQLAPAIHERDPAQPLAPRFPLKSRFRHNCAAPVHLTILNPARN